MTVDKPTQQKTEEKWIIKSRSTKKKFRCIVCIILPTDMPSIKIFNASVVLAGQGICGLKINKILNNCYSWKKNQTIIDTYVGERCVSVSPVWVDGADVCSMTGTGWRQGQRVVMETTGVVACPQMQQIIGAREAQIVQRVCRSRPRAQPEATRQLVKMVEPAIAAWTYNVV